jgi:hypothetical protein
MFMEYSGAARPWRDGRQHLPGKGVRRPESAQSVARFAHCCAARLVL